MLTLPGLTSCQEPARSTRIFNCASGTLGEYLQLRNATQGGSLPPHDAAQVSTSGGHAPTSRGSYVSAVTPAEEQ